MVVQQRTRRNLRLMAHDPAGVRHDCKGKKNQNADALQESRVPGKRRRAPNERRTVLTTGEVLSRRDSTSRRRVGNVETEHFQDRSTTLRIRNGQLYKLEQSFAPD